MRLRKQPPLRGVGRCARRSARRAGRQGASGKRRAAPRRSPRPGSAGRVLASEGRGCATQAAPDGRNVPGWDGAGRGKPLAHHPTGASGDRAPTERPARADRLCKAGAATGVAGCGLAKADGLCNGWRAPSRRRGRRTGKRAAPGADPRATFVERAQRAEPARRPAARVGRGRPAGRGVRAAAARQQGAPLPCAG